MKTFFYIFLFTIFFISFMVLGSLYVSCSRLNENLNNVNNSKTTENDYYEKKERNKLFFKSFGFLKIFNEELISKDYYGVIQGNTITITIDEVTDLLSLKPTFETNIECDVYCEGIINESSGDTNNFYKTLSYKLKYLDDESYYTVKVIYDKEKYFELKKLTIKKSLNSTLPVSFDINAKIENKKIIIEMPKYFIPENIVFSFEILSYFRLWTNQGIEIKNEKTKIDLTKTEYLIIENPANEKISYSLQINYTIEPEVEYVIEMINSQISKIVNEGGNFYKMNSYGYEFQILNYESIFLNDKGDLISIDYTTDFYIDYSIKNETFQKRIHYKEELTPPETPKKRLLNIYAIAPDGPSGSYDECIILYNPSERYTNLQNVKIYYQTANSQQLKLKYQIKDFLILRPKGYILIASSQFVPSGWDGETAADLVSENSWSLSGTGGHIVISNINDEEIDRVGYGNAQFPEKEAINVSKGKLIYRKNPDIDTDNNKEDFTVNNKIGGILKNRTSR